MKLVMKRSRLPLSLHNGLTDFVHIILCISRIDRKNKQMTRQIIEPEVTICKKSLEMF